MSPREHCFHWPSNTADGIDTIFHLGRANSGFQSMIMLIIYWMPLLEFKWVPDARASFLHKVTSPKQRLPEHGYCVVAVDHTAPIVVLISSSGKHYLRQLTEACMRLRHTPETLHGRMSKTLHGRMSGGMTSIHTGSQYKCMLAEVPSPCMNLHLQCTWLILFCLFML